MGKITIERRAGIPVPHGEKYPFIKLGVGDAFSIDDPSAHNTLRSTASRLGKRLNRKFSVRKSGNGLKVYRIK